MLEYAIGVCLAGVLAYSLRSHDMSDGFLAVAASWLAWCLFIVATGIYEPWHFGILIDSCAAWWLLRHPSSRMKSVLASIFLVQIAMHIAYGGNILLRGSADWEAYYSQTQFTGWMQLLIVGVWGIGLLAGRALPIGSSLHLSRNKKDS